MRRRWRFGLAAFGVWIAFLAVQIGGLALASPLAESGAAVGDDPGDPRIGVAFVVGLLIATAIMYTAFRFGLKLLIRGFVFLVTFGITWFVFSVVIPPVAAPGGVHIIAIVGALALSTATFRLDQWWLIDLQAIVLGMGIVSLFGISLGVLPIVVLLVLLAIYDAISVYGTKHMVTLAEDAVSIGLPVLLVIPLGNDEAEDGDPDDPAAEEPWQNAMYIGLGDAAIPSILIVSATVHGPVEASAVGAIALSTPALGALVGIAVGLAALLGLTAQGRAHAGLPLLNTGAIGGYIIGALVVGVGPLEAIGAAGLM